MELIDKLAMLVVGLCVDGIKGEVVVVLSEVGEHFLSEGACCSSCHNFAVGVALIVEERKNASDDELEAAL